MQNYIVLEENKLQTPYGILAGVDAFSCHPGGELSGVILSEKNMIMTQIGELVPAYTETTRRKHKPSVEFNKQGMIISVALDQQQKVLTPIGELPGELVKFYPTGELHRIFILDGKISGFWTEEEERQLNIPLTFDLNFTEFRAMINGLCFYPDGAIKSITLFPGEEVTVKTPVGQLKTKVGISLYESGALKSIEPSEPVSVTTKIGTIIAYDPDQIGIHADSNSLSFTEDGMVSSLITCDNSIYIQTKDEQLVKHSPIIKTHPMADDQLTVSGFRVEFDYEADEVILLTQRYSLKDCGFTIEPFKRPGFYCSPSDCANCSLCNKG
ncbi:hypothetical protein [Clostridium sp. E02]|uniref:hypothetical protein n=1 Tax=Clostridium sp. E02 TaxID=2487134 RepID=UPI000F5470AD|nr:hypothetical protein [Clostridium sp. E02]